MQKSPLLCFVVRTEEFLTIFLTVFWVLDDWGLWELDLLLPCDGIPLLLQIFNFCLLCLGWTLVLIIVREISVSLALDWFCPVFGFVFFKTLKVSWNWLKNSVGLSSYKTSRYSRGTWAAPFRKYFFSALLFLFIHPFAI